jgi:hypothetical protein
MQDTVASVGGMAGFNASCTVQILQRPTFRNFLQTFAETRTAADISRYSGSRALEVPS